MVLLLDALQRISGLEDLQTQINSLKTQIGMHPTLGSLPLYARSDADAAFDLDNFLRKDETEGIPYRTSSYGRTHATPDLKKQGDSDRPDPYHAKVQSKPATPKATTSQPEPDAWMRASEKAGDKGGGGGSEGPSRQPTPKTDKSGPRMLLNESNVYTDEDGLNSEQEFGLESARDPKAEADRAKKQAAYQKGDDPKATKKGEGNTTARDSDVLADV
jgi:hypothetical protein